MEGECVCVFWSEWVAVVWARLDSLDRSDGKRVDCIDIGKWQFLPVDGLAVQDWCVALDWL